MSKKVFVPLSDELIYEHPELISGPIEAYNPQWSDGSCAANITSSQTENRLSKQRIDLSEVIGAA